VAFDPLVSEVCFLPDVAIGMIHSPALLSCDHWLTEARLSSLMCKARNTVTRFMFTLDRNPNSHAIQPKLSGLRAA
jgi:hypothetical protein